MISDKEKEYPSQLNGDISYKIGDTINLKGRDYIFEDISLRGDTIQITYLRENTRPVGITEGYYITDFDVSRLDNSVFSLEEYPDKYVLIDFWGTWCIPCIKLIPELKQLNSEFKDKDFLLVSVAYDKDISKVSKFVEKQEMDWEHVFIDQGKADNNSLIEKLKIRSFPSTLLIAPDGKIVARNKRIEKLREILINAL